MDKQDLLRSIAESGYNIGFGAEKHYVTYGMYAILPKLLSFSILSVGIIQFTSWYKRTLNGDIQDILSAILIILGILTLVIDMASKNKETLDAAGKELCDRFNQLRCMYYEIKSAENNIDLKPYKDQLKEINDAAKIISISDQAFFSNTITNLKFFHGGKQIEWINEIRPFKITDKFAFLHPESFIIYFIVLIGLFFITKAIINWIIYFSHCLVCC